MYIAILGSILLILIVYMMVGAIQEERRMEEEKRAFKAINGEGSFKFKALTQDRRKVEVNVKMKMFSNQEEKMGYCLFETGDIVHTSSEKPLKGMCIINFRENNEYGEPEYLLRIYCTSTELDSFNSYEDNKLIQIDWTLMYIKELYEINSLKDYENIIKRFIRLSLNGALEEIYRQNRIKCGMV